jgi:leucyl aminopeptidase
VTTINLSSSKAEGLRVDALVVGIARRDGRVVLVPGAEAVDRAMKGRLTATVSSLGGTGKTDDIVKVAALGAVKATVVVAVGLGDEAKTYDAERLRRAAGAAVRSLAGTAKVALALPAGDAEQVGAVAEGALMGGYAFHRYRVASKEGHRPPVEAVTILTDLARDKGAKAALARAEVVVDAVNLCRDLVNTPPSDLYPEVFAAEALGAAKGLAVKVEVLDEKELKKAGYGGILGVGQGSVHPPRLVKLSYKPARAKIHLALVGKGITFDSGGLSLKPAQSMEWMKSDMGGAAAVIAAVTAIARLGLPIQVTGWAPMAENMPSGTAQRPSDVLHIYGGKTVEVLNTDAEGRLILADAIVRAGEESPDLLIDVATLTGAQLVALGARTGAIMSNDDEVREQIYGATQRAGDAMWPMPLPPELRASMDSEVADIANMGDRYGGMLVAGLFLKEFVPEGQRWAHLDIAGPAFNDGKPHGYTPKGGTGAAVRTFVALAEDLVNGHH